MGKGIGILIFSVLAAPAMGLLASIHAMDHIVAVNDFSHYDQVAQACLDPLNSTAYGCDEFRTSRLLFWLSAISLAVTLLLPLLYWLSAALLARDRDALSRWFPPLVRVSLVLLLILLVAHGVLVLFATWRLGEERLLRSGHIFGALLALGGGLIFAAWSILVDLRRLLEIDPLRVTGLLIEPARFPSLFARVKRIADKLQSRVPEHIVLGIEPTAFVTAMPVRLRGVGDLPAGETLYLSTVALRTLRDEELDAFIGHELGHFRGKDLEFSQRFAPAFKSLELAAESVSDDDESENKWLRMARLPAIGLLTFMLFVLSRVTSRIKREREFAADRASLEVSNPRATTSQLIKFSALTLQWEFFRAGVSNLLHEGVGRRNLSLDYLAQTRARLRNSGPDEMRLLLTDSRTPHPLDTHPPLSERAKAVGLEPATMMNGSLADLMHDREDAGALVAIEEEITQTDQEYSRVPGRPLTLSVEPDPPALRLNRD